MQFLQIFYKNTQQLKSNIYKHKYNNKLLLCFIIFNHNSFFLILDILFLLTDKDKY